MPNIFFEKDSLKKLNNDEFIEKYKSISSKYSLLNNKNINQETRQQILLLYNAYSEELDRRLALNLIDEDELDDFYL